MVATIARVWHLVELALLSALALHLVRSYGWGWTGAVVCATALAPGWRLLGNALVYVAACMVDGPRPAAHRVSMLQRIQLVVREAWVFTAAYAWYQMWPARYGRELPLGPSADASPVVLLVHGYFCNGGVWAWFVPWLESAGFQVRTVSLEPVYGTIEASADQLHQRLVQLHQAQPNAPIVLVCHSMGGLVTRACLARHGLPGVIRVITLGTPHHGTALAAIGMGVNGRQMRAGGDWVAAGHGANLPRSIDTITVLTWDDNLVSPRLNAHLDGAHPVALEGVGHLSMVASRRVFDVVLQRLPAPRA